MCGTYSDHWAVLVTTISVHLAKGNPTVTPVMSVRLAQQVKWLLWSDTDVSDKHVAYIFRVGDIRTGSEVKITHIPLHRIFPSMVPAYNKHAGIAL